MVLEMKKQDLIELYQLMGLYQRTYAPEGDLTLSDWMRQVEKTYRRASLGKEIQEARNPRNAGRKTVYSMEQNAEILKIYQTERSLRKTARQAGCSVSHVQDVIRQQREKGRCQNVPG